MGKSAAGSSPVKSLPSIRPVTPGDGSFEDVPLVVEKLAAPVSGNTFPEGVVTLFHRSDRHEQEVPEEIEVVEQA
jgi:hypothetical protein